MEVKHVIIKDAYKYPVSGLLKIRIHYHGGGSTDIINHGTYTETNFIGSYHHPVLGTIDENTMGVSGVSLISVLEIVE